MSQTAIDAKLEAEFAAVAAGEGCELVHVDYRQGRLRVFLDRPQGVTLDDCQTVSKQLSALLDVSDFGDARYFLEVSSPGLDRELYSARDFERFRGEVVRVTFSSGQPRTKRTIVGRLEAFQAPAGPAELAAGAEISVTERETEKRYDISLQDIVKARLEPEI
jgi:ribosome maturation factor RimP